MSASNWTTCRRIADGEVSPYLIGLTVGEEIELRGPIGGWFVLGGRTRKASSAARRRRIRMGTFMAMLGSGPAATGGWSIRFRSPADVYYAEELVRLERECGWLRESNWSTRARPHRAGSATVTSRRPGGSPIMAHAGNFAAQRDSWNR